MRRLRTRSSCRELSALRTWLGGGKRQAGCRASTHNECATRPHVEGRRTHHAAHRRRVRVHSEASLCWPKKQRGTDVSAALDRAIDRLIASVTLDETGCWLAGRRLDPSGYKRSFVSQDHRPRNPFSHRLSYEYFRSPIPEGLTIDHLCRVRHCVNPWHLEPVTRGENVARGYGVSARVVREGICKAGHPFTDVYVRPNGKRECRVCQRLRDRVWQAKKRREVAQATKGMGL